MAIGQMGLVLTGGGARGAYQAGALSAIAELCTKNNMPYPFPIVTGVSAGAINASFWATQAHNIEEGMQRLVKIWDNVTFDQVFNDDLFSVAVLASRLILDVSSAPISGSHLSQALLNTKPLKRLIESSCDFENIQKNIDQKYLKAIAVSATDYASSISTTFVQGSEPIEMWQRQMRKSVRTMIRADHILASSAIPIFFPPAEVNGEYYGDGCLRNNAPLSPAIHLGADKLVIVGVRKQPPSSEIQVYLKKRPSIGRVLSIVLNAILLDGVDSDLERLSRINRTLELIPSSERHSLTLRPVSVFTIYPTQDLGKMAEFEKNRLPRTIKFLMKGLGPLEESTALLSYLLFDPTFCGKLTELGYRDVMQRKNEFEAFLEQAT